MILTKDSHKKLREGIVNAYTEDDLVILLRENMDIDFNAIALASEGNDSGLLTERMGL
ncbi:MAG: hypothetical protein RLZZ148_3104 [Cyanobacteriota bacterium]